MTGNKTLIISGGVYLVVDPAMETGLLLSKLAAALDGGLQAVQLWNNWAPGADRLAVTAAIGRLCRAYQVPLLANEDWVLLQQSPFVDGIHLDRMPAGFEKLSAAVEQPFLKGVTVGNDLETVRMADHYGFGYISFCSMFPSASAGSCELVMPQTVLQARALTAMPIFVAGGVTPANLRTLKSTLPVDGVAAISGILGADDPALVVRQYAMVLNKTLCE